ncbi:MAG: hypothetical protein HY264_01045 [Chloroflexi bacterium]|nr:hypothetical protein [Chloroflexota bacterium]
MQAGWALIAALEAEMHAENALLFSARLLDPARAKVVQPRRRMVKTTDGPFAETKEHLGGFYIIDARDLDEALAWAQKVTTRAPSSPTPRGAPGISTGAVRSAPV